MIFNETVIGNHPATSGYIIECLVRGSEDTAVFDVSGSGRLKIEFPEFSITGLEFEGKNLLFLPTGEEPEEKLMDNVQILQGNINLKALFSGDLNTVGDGLSIQNIKQVDVFSGGEPNFEVDLIGNTNRISRFSVSLDPEETSFTVNILDTQITDEEDNPRVEENIFYKVVPIDFLTFGDASPAASGIMFSGFETFTKIETDEFIISRTNGNDITVGRGQTVDIFTGTDIIIDDTVPLDFYSAYKISTTEKVTISGSGGATLVSSSTLFPVTDNKITIDAVAGDTPSFSEFDIACLLDQNNERTNYIIGEL